ncbi:unnamed protein product, partial [Porites evermanni]
MSNVLLLDHLTPRLQQLYSDAKEFKLKYGYQFCWARNGSIFLRYSADEGSKLLKVFRSQLTLFHNNVCSLKSNLENLQTHLLNELDFHFNIIGVTETRITNSNFIDFNPNITGYNFEYVPTPLSAGGVGMY